MRQANFFVTNDDAMDGMGSTSQELSGGMRKPPTEGTTNNRTKPQRALSANQNRRSLSSTFKNSQANSMAKLKYMDTKRKLKRQGQDDNLPVVEFDNLKWISIINAYDPSRLKNITVKKQGFSNFYGAHNPDKDSLGQLYTAPVINFFGQWKNKINRKYFDVLNLFFQKENVSDLYPIQDQLQSIKSMSNQMLGLVQTVLTKYENHKFRAIATSFKIPLEHSFEVLQSISLIFESSTKIEKLLTKLEGKKNLKKILQEFHNNKVEQARSVFRRYHNQYQQEIVQKVSKDIGKMIQLSFSALDSMQNMKSVIDRVKQVLAKKSNDLGFDGLNGINEIFMEVLRMARLFKDSSKSIEDNTFFNVEFKNKVRKYEKEMDENKEFVVKATFQILKSILSTMVATFRTYFSANKSVGWDTSGLSRLQKGLLSNAASNLQAEGVALGADLRQFSDKIVPLLSSLKSHHKKLVSASQTLNRPQMCIDQVSPSVITETTSLIRVYKKNMSRLISAFQKMLQLLQGGESPNAQRMLTEDEETHFMDRLCNLLKFIQGIDINSMFCFKQHSQLSFKSKSKLQQVTALFLANKQQLTRVASQLRKFGEISSNNQLPQLIGSLELKSQPLMHIQTLVSILADSEAVTLLNVRTVIPNMVSQINTLPPDPSINAFINKLLFSCLSKFISHEQACGIRDQLCRLVSSKDQSCSKLYLQASSLKETLIEVSQLCDLSRFPLLREKIAEVIGVFAQVDLIYDLSKRNNLLHPNTEFLQRLLQQLFSAVVGTPTSNYLPNIKSSCNIIGRQLLNLRQLKEAGMYHDISYVSDQIETALTCTNNIQEIVGGKLMIKVGDSVDHLRLTNHFGSVIKESIRLLVSTQQDFLCLLTASNEPLFLCRVGMSSVPVLVSSLLQSIGLECKQEWLRSYLNNLERMSYTEYKRSHQSHQTPKKRPLKRKVVQDSGRNQLSKGKGPDSDRQSAISQSPVDNSIDQKMLDNSNNHPCQQPSDSNNSATSQCQVAKSNRKRRPAKSKPRSKQQIKSASIASQIHDQIEQIGLLPTDQRMSEEIIEVDCSNQDMIEDQIEEDFQRQPIQTIEIKCSSSSDTKQKTISKQSTVQSKNKSKKANGPVFIRLKTVQSMAGFVTHITKWTEYSETYKHIINVEPLMRLINNTYRSKFDSLDKNFDFRECASYVRNNLTAFVTSVDDELKDNFLKEAIVCNDSFKRITGTVNEMRPLLQDSNMSREGFQRLAKSVQGLLLSLGCPYSKLIDGDQNIICMGEGRETGQMFVRDSLGMININFSQDQVELLLRNHLTEVSQDVTILKSMGREELCVASNNELLEQLQFINAKELSVKFPSSGIENVFASALAWFAEPTSLGLQNINLEVGKFIDGLRETAQTKFRGILKSIQSLVIRHSSALRLKIQTFQSGVHSQIQRLRQGLLFEEHTTNDLNTLDRMTQTVLASWMLDTRGLTVLQQKTTRKSFYLGQLNEERLQSFCLQMLSLFFPRVQIDKKWLRLDVQDGIVLLDYNIIADGMVQQFYSLADVAKKREALGQLLDLINNKLGKVPDNSQLEMSGIVQKQVETLGNLLHTRLIDSDMLHLKFQGVRKLVQERKVFLEYLLRVSRYSIDSHESYKALVEELLTFEPLYGGKLCLFYSNEGTLIIALPFDQDCVKAFLQKVVKTVEPSVQQSIRQSMQQSGNRVTCKIPPLSILFKFAQNVEDSESHVGNIQLKISSGDTDMYNGRLKGEIDLPYLFHQMDQVVVEISNCQSTIHREELRDILPDCHSIRARQCQKALRMLIDAKIAEEQRLKERLQRQMNAQKELEDRRIQLERQQEERKRNENQKRFDRNPPEDYHGIQTQVGEYQPGLEHSVTLSEGFLLDQYEGINRGSTSIHQIIQKAKNSAKRSP